MISLYQYIGRNNFIKRFVGGDVIIGRNETSELMPQDDECSAAVSWDIAMQCCRTHCNAYHLTSGEHRHSLKINCCVIFLQ